VGQINSNKKIESRIGEIIEEIEEIEQRRKEQGTKSKRWNPNARARARAARG